jgi:hypothetical protein
MQYARGDIQGGVGGKYASFKYTDGSNRSKQTPISFVASSTGNKKNAIIGNLGVDGKYYAFRAVGDITTKNYDLKFDLNGDGSFNHSQNITNEEQSVKVDDIITLDGKKLRYLTSDTDNLCAFCSSYARFWNITDNKWTNFKLTFTNNQAIGTISLNDKNYLLRSEGNTSSPDFDLKVDLNGDGNIE